MNLEGLKPDKNGVYSKNIGWKFTASGNRSQPKFRVGKDKRTARKRLTKIALLWEAIQDSDPADPIWDDTALAVAQAIADDDHTVRLRRQPNEQPADFLNRIEEASVRFAGVRFLVIEDDDTTEYRVANEDEEKQRAEQIARLEEELRRLNKSQKKKQSGKSRSSHMPILGAENEEQPCLFDALDDYKRQIQKSYIQPVEGSNGEQQLTPWGHQQVRNIGRLRERHHNMPIPSLTFDGCQSLIDLWRNRPMVKGKSTPMRVSSCRHQIKQLMAFFRWLNRTSLYDWRKPLDFDELKTNVPETEREQAARLSPVQVDTFTVEELALLNEYATPIERAFLLLGLNCGYKQAEIATVRLDQLCICQRHPHAKFFEFETADEDSFISRPRIKSGVYGVHILWKLTVQAIQWAIERRKAQRHIIKGEAKGTRISLEPDSYLLLSESGHPYTKRTKSGNRNSRIANRWASLTKRIQTDHAEFRCLPHSALRKTAGTMIRQEFDGEIMGLFLCHGRVVRSDDLAEIYFNRPFGRLFEALRWLEVKLQPMFDATPEDPFPPIRKKGGTNLTRRQLRIIKEMSRHGASVAEIARRVKVSRMTVYRHWEKPS